MSASRYGRSRCCWASEPFKGRLREGGTLADVAPTLLAMLEIAAPSEMTGRDLRERS